MATSSRELRVLIVGAGFGGIAAAVELRRHGFEDLTILDAADGIGGTWLHNSYPGAACDVPSPLYSYSFAKRDDWSHLCAEQPAILTYLRSVAAELGIDKLVTTATPVAAADWDETTATWTVRAEDGREWAADVLILATGQLNRPKIPALPGLANFAGHSFHSARWDHDHDMRGRRVAVIGNGASAVQFVPRIAEEVAELRVFQRSGNWFLPRRNTPYPKFVREGIQRIPGVQDLRRAFWFQYCELLTVTIRHPKSLGRLMAARSAAFMRWQLRGSSPELVRKAMPDYQFGCKRVLFSSHFLRSLTRPNVELVTDEIAEVVPEGLRTEDGRVHPCDTIIWATGFATNDFMFPLAVTGRAGIGLREVWADGAHAHLGMTVPEFPSMFVLYGPNTNTSGGSIIWFLERQVRYVRQVLSVLRSRGAAAIEVRPEVERDWNDALQQRFAGTAWLGGCDSWYLDPNGRNVANWPGYMAQYRKTVRRVDPQDFRLLPIPGQ